MRYVPYEALGDEPNILVDGPTQLSDLESGRGRWIFEGVEQITPKLGLTGAEESQIAPEEFVKRVKTFLASGAANVS